ncbi:MAG: GDSL-type esterase/lipase family protein [Phycisphaerales bacterium]
MLNHRLINLVLVLVALHVAAVSAFAQVRMLGTVGDSLTDEYTEETYNYARNWTMQLVTQRALDMGPTASQASGGQPGATWGEPRRIGYWTNWARSGADSAAAIGTGQHTGVAAQVGLGGVTHVVIAVGANDFNPQTGVYFNIYWGLWSQATIDNYVNARAANITTIVQTIRTTGAGIVLCNAVDFGLVPASRGVFTNASRRGRVASAVAQLNTRIEAIARDNHALLVDLNNFTTQIIGTHTSLRQFIPIGNVSIQLFNRDTATNTNALAGFVDDGAHPHTTLQGAFSNLMMTAFNNGWGGRFDTSGAAVAFNLLTDAEILALANIPYGGAETLTTQIGPYSQYLRSYLCPGDLDFDQSVNTSDLVLILAAFGQPVQPGTNGDTNRDGIVTTADLVAFLGVFGVGCP